MARISMPCLTQLLLVAALFTTSITASPAPRPIAVPKIFSRQASENFCGGNSVRCPQQGLGNFCCPSGTRCIGVLGNTSVGCCPEGQDCRIIAQSECQKQDDALLPGLTECNGSNKCCSPGYFCDGQFCQLEFDSWKNVNTDDSNVPSPTGEPAIATLIGDGTFLTDAQKKNGFIHKDEAPLITVAGVGVGILPGLIVGAALVWIVICTRKKRKENLIKNGLVSRTPSYDRGNSSAGLGRKTSSRSNEPKTYGHSQPKRTTSRGTGSSSKSKHDLTIGFNPNIVVPTPTTTPQSATRPEGLGVSNLNLIAGPGYAVSNTSTQMFSMTDEPTDPSRRGRLRVHGMTPPLPSLHGLGSATLASPQHHRSDSLQKQGPIPEQQPMASETSLVSSPPPSESSKASNKSNKDGAKGHKRKNSNPSFKDVASTSRFKFRNLLSHENLRENRGSMNSETSVGSSYHSSVFSERQSRGNRYPIAVHQASNSNNSSTTPTSLRHEMLPIQPVQRSNTRSTDEHTPIEDSDYTPITPSNPKAFVDSNAPVLPPAPAHIPPAIKVPHPPRSASHSHWQPGLLREPLTSPELQEKYLHVPGTITASTSQSSLHHKNSRASVATTMTEMTEIEGYKSPFHDRNRYRSSYTSNSDDANSDDDYMSDDGEDIREGRSVAAQSTYPHSFLDIHFDAVSPISPLEPGARGTYGPNGLSGLRHQPSIPSIPPLFMNKNQPIEQAPSKTALRQTDTSELSAASCDITVVMDDGTGLVSPRFRPNFGRVDSPNPSVRTMGIGMGIGGAMTGGRYTMQTHAMNGQQ